MKGLSQFSLFSGGITRFFQFERMMDIVLQ